MKGVQLPAANGAYTLADGLPVPKPASNQVLVKSLASGINPVDEFMRGGLFIDSWPIVIGVDASGVVVEVGADVKTLKKGDYVFGCTRLGVQGHGTFQEFFLMDDKLTFKRPSKITVEQAATIGVGSLTASIGLCAGLGVVYPEPGNAPEKDEWLIVFGGSGSVGQFAVQLAKISGYKVLASCSPSSEAATKAIGASATFNHRLPEEEQLATIKSITSGKFCRAYDASAQSSGIALRALKKSSTMGGQGYFTTVNDWVPIAPVEGVSIHMVRLGPIGRLSTASDLGSEVNKEVASYIPKIEAFLEHGLLKPVEYKVVGEVGFEAVLEAEKLLSEGKAGGKKMVVVLQKE